MAIPRQRQLELEAEVEYELEQEQAQGGALPPYVDDPNNLGSDYKRTFGGNVTKGARDLPEGLWEFGKDLTGLIGSPIDTIAEAGAEKTADTTGMFASGLAGATLGGKAGIAAGTAFPILGPWTPVLGGALGGALGLAGGITGFDVLKDFSTDTTNQIASTITGEAPSEEYLRPTEEYAKDFGYNFGGGLLGEGIFRAPAAARAFRGKPPYEPSGASGIDKQVHETLEKARPGYAQALDELAAKDSYNQLPDNRSISEILNSDELRSLERTIRQEPGNLDKYQETRNARNESQLNALDSLEPSPVQIEYPQEVIREARANEISNAEAAIANAEVEVATALNKVRQPVDSSELGAKIREGVTEGEANLRDLAKKEFNKTTEEVVSLQSVEEAIQPELSKYFREVGSQPDPTLMDLINSLSKSENTGLVDANNKPITKIIPRTLKDVQALRSEALDIGRNGDPKSKAVANTLADLLLKAGEDAVGSGKVSPEAVNGWKEGIRLWKEKLDIFDSPATPAKSVLAKDSHGNFKYPNSAISESFWKKGSKATGFKGQKEAIDNYKASIGATEAALEPIYQSATNSFRRYAVRENPTTGKFEVDARAARQWLNDHAAALDELPDLKEQFSSVERAQSFLEEKFGDLKRTKAETELAALDYFINADPSKAIPSILSGKNPTGKLRALMNELQARDPIALAGLRRGIIEYIKNKGTVTAELGEAGLEGVRTKGAVFSKTMSDVFPILEKSDLFSKTQIELFKEIYKDKQSQLSIDNARPAGSPTYQHSRVFDFFLKTMGASFLRNHIPIAGQWVTSKLIPALEKIPREQFLARLNEAILDRRIARDLNQKATARNIARTASEIFKDELGSLTLGQGAAAAVKAGSVTEIQGEKPSPRVFNQQKVTSGATFPKPAALNGKDYLQEQSKETQARISVESSGNPDAVSPKGAQGLSQLMPETGREIAMELGEEYRPIHPGMSATERESSIKQNIRFGDHYYNKQLKEFKDRTLAWAAYNAGPSRVREAMKTAGTSRDVNKILAALPKNVQKETIPYVRKIAAKYGRV